ncbi:MAG: sigma-E factor regulatory protein RseB domain-containing protein, partial [Planctomycetota bacterium]
MRLRWPWLVLAGLLATSPLVGAALRHVHEQAEAWDLVRRAATAHQRVSYRGQAAWRRARWGKAVTVTHDAESGLTRYDWGRRRAYVQSGPNSRTPDPAAWCLDIGALEESYNARAEGRTVYGGRSARTLVLQPRYVGRPELHLTVDAETSLPLEVASLRPNGKLYRTAAYRDLEIGPQEVRRRRSASWLGRSVAEAALEEEAGFGILAPAYLPPGFRCIDRRVSEWAAPHVRLLFTDGITAFELSEEAVLTPAQMHTNLSRRVGRERAGRMMKHLLWR